MSSYIVNFPLNFQRAFVVSTREIVAICDDVKSASFHLINLATGEIAPICKLPGIEHEISSTVLPNLDAASIVSVEKSGPLILIDAARQLGETNIITIWSNNKLVHVINAPTHTSPSATIIHFSNPLRTTNFILTIQYIKGVANVILFDRTHILHQIALNSASLLRSAEILVDRAPEFTPIKWFVRNGRFAIYGKSAAYIGEISMPCHEGFTTSVDSIDYFAAHNGKTSMPHIDTCEPIPSKCHWGAASIKMAFHGDLGDFITANETAAFYAKSGILREVATEKIIEREITNVTSSDTIITDTIAVDPSGIILGYQSGMVIRDVFGKWVVENCDFTPANSRPFEV